MEQEDGLDAEYALRQNATLATPPNAGDSPIVRGGGVQPSSATADSATSEQEDAHILDDYVIINDDQVPSGKRPPPTFVHVPTTRGGRARFDLAHIAAGRPADNNADNDNDGGDSDGAEVQLRPRDASQLTHDNHADLKSSLDMAATSQNRQIVGTKSSTAESATQLDDYADVESDGEEVESSGPQAFDHVTEPRLRRFLNRLHRRSPARAQQACEHYVRRMTQLLGNDGGDTVEEPSIATLTLNDRDTTRLEFAHEHILLPTGHRVTTVPRAHFNYLPEEVYAEIRDFETAADRVSARRASHFAAAR